MALRVRREGLIGSALALLTAVGASAQTAKDVSFTNDVAPILSKNCAQCHAQSPGMGNFDLHSRDAALKGGTHGAAIVPGDAANSRLYQQLTGAQKPQMPLGGKLTDQEISVIKNWIAAGAVWDSATAVTAAAPSTEHKFTEAQRRYWAFQPVAKLAPPAVKESALVH